jgi:hypothetical protein
VNEVNIAGENTDRQVVQRMVDGLFSLNEAAELGLRFVGDRTMW